MYKNKLSLEIMAFLRHFKWIGHRFLEYFINPYMKSSFYLHASSLSQVGLIQCFRPLCDKSFCKVIDNKKKEWRKIVARAKETVKKSICKLPYHTLAVHAILFQSIRFFFCSTDFRVSCEHTHHSCKALNSNSFNNHTKNAHHSRTKLGIHVDWMKMR